MVLEKQEVDAAGVDGRKCHLCKGFVQCPNWYQKRTVGGTHSNPDPFQTQTVRIAFSTLCWHKVTFYRMRVNTLVLNVGRIEDQRSRIILIKTRLKKQ